MKPLWQGVTTPPSAALVAAASAGALFKSAFERDSTRDRAARGELATHVLRRDLPARPDWADATKAANPMLAKRGRELVQALGYTVEALASGASMLTADGRRHAVAVFCAKTDTFESPLQPVLRKLARGPRLRPGRQTTPT